jgi:peptidoglycan/xylan/chitin deacetylase (PgdA/CDA1 family)
LDKENSNANPVSIEARKKRVKKIKKLLVIVVLVLLILPTFLCIVMFVKLSSIQKQVDLLMIEQYGITYNTMKSKHNDHIAYAATRKYDSILEEIGNSEYNIDDRLNVFNKIKKRQEFLFLYGKVSPYQYQLETKEIPTYDIRLKKLIKAQNQGTLLTASNTTITKLSTDKQSQKSDNKTENKDNENVIATNDKLNTDKVSKDKNNKDKTSKDKTSKDKSSKDKSKSNTSKKVDVTTSSDESTKKSSSADKKKDVKEVYLTFDDGPSKFTDDILDILNEYNVKATFFVIGKTDKQSKKMYKRIVAEGHTLGMHSYSHNYKTIYNSLEDFEKDFTKLQNLLYDTTGYFPNLYRFPGGSSNSVSNMDISVFIKYLCEKSVIYYDWNVDNGDATGKSYSPEELCDNVLSGIKAHDRSIVLMHDTDSKENTVKSLKLILDNLTTQDIEILPLQDNVTPIQQVKVSSIEQKK